MFIDSLNVFLNTFQDFITKLNDFSSSGAIFFAVCRGKVCINLISPSFKMICFPCLQKVLKIFILECYGMEVFQVSEGLDFADKAGRAVVITGIPYAMKTDPKV